MSLRVILLLALAIPIAPHLALGQIDVTWNNCTRAASGEPAPSFNQDFQCKSSATYRLYGSFQVPVELPTFHVMDVRLELATIRLGTAQPLSPFWHFEAGGCNASGLQLRVQRDMAGDGNVCTLFESPWGNPKKELEFALITAYGPDYQRPGRGVLLMSIGRVRGQPYPLQANTHYFAFYLEWTTANASRCEGCEDQLLIVSSANLFSRDEFLMSLTGPTLKAEKFYAKINDPDFPDPLIARTWGQIKSQYR